VRAGRKDDFVAAKAVRQKRCARIVSADELSGPRALRFVDIRSTGSSRCAWEGVERSTRPSPPTSSSSQPSMPVAALEHARYGAGMGSRRVRARASSLVCNRGRGRGRPHRLPKPDRRRPQLGTSRSRVHHRRNGPYDHRRVGANTALHPPTGGFPQDFPRLIIAVGAGCLPPPKCLHGIFGTPGSQEAGTDR
jgi:hypothetical protein